MSEATITAEDLSLYALDLLTPEEAERVEAVLRSSSEAREELSLIRGDLAALALGTAQHTPPALTRQRLMKQVARERRIVPIATAVAEATRYRAEQASFPAPSFPTPSAGQINAGRNNAARNNAAQTNAEQNDTAQSTTQQASIALPRVFGRDEPLLPTQSAQAFGGDRLENEAPGTDWVPQSRQSASNASSEAEPIVRDPESRRTAVSRRSGSRAAEVPRRREETSAGPALEALFREQDMPEDRYSPGPELSFSAYGKAHDASPSNRFATLFGWVGWAVACGFAVATLFAVRQNFTLGDKVQRQAATLSQTNVAAQRAQTIIQALQSSAAQQFVLARTDTPAVPSGRVAYLPEQGMLVFQGNNLAELPPYKSYELWLIPAGEGRQPVPAGTFKPDARGFAGVVLPELPRGTIASNFGITIEDEGGSQTPTLPILLVGQQG